MGGAIKALLYGATQSVARGTALLTDFSFCDPFSLAQAWGADMILRIMGSILNLFAAQNLPFAVALALMIMLLIVQIFGLVADHDLPSGEGADLGAVDGLFSIAGLNRLPLMTWLTIFLGLFGLIGLAGQALIQSLIGTPLNAWLAGLTAAVCAVPVTGLIARPVAALMPHDETTAIERAELVGLSARVMVGTASTGQPARAEVRDLHGQVHLIMVEPDNAGQSFPEGCAVRLVRQQGDIFRVIGDGTMPVTWLQVD